MNNKELKINLSFFGDFGKDFFTNAFNEAYNITEGSTEDTEVPSDAPESTESVSEPQVEEIPAEKEETPQKPSKEEVEQMYKEYFGEPEVKEPELDEETQSAIELYKYLEKNPHLIQAMRDVDVEGYSTLNNYVPDEVTKRLQQMEDYIQEQQYNAYIKELQDKYSDFDEDKVLEYAEKHEVLDLEVAYKAMKSDSIKEPNIDELKEQIRKELLEELKQNSLNTQSIVSGISQKPIETQEVNLSAKEQRIARAMGMTLEEYAKWR